MLPHQQNLQRATELAFDALTRQSADQIAWLGGERAGDRWRLPVLDDVFEVDTLAGRVTTAAGPEVGAAWRILALHYLAVRVRPEPRPPEITFGDLPTARSYAGVYQQRAVGRLCATVGREALPLRVAAAALGGRPVDGGDAAFNFDVFPRVTMRLVWHAGDEEFPSSATLLLPTNIDSYFCTEDIVVLSERLVSRLAGRPF
jgi:hypothetical protein